MSRLLFAVAVLGLGHAPAQASWPRPPFEKPAPQAEVSAALVDPLDVATEALRATFRAQPLAERCALTRALAERVVTAHDATHALPVSDGGVGFAILLPEDVPLLAAGEACEASVMTRQPRGAVTVTLDPAKIDGPYLFVDWTPAALRPGQPLRFQRGAYEGAPPLNLEKPRQTRRSRMMTFLGEGPTLEVEALRRGDTWAVSMRYVFPTRSAPAR